MRLHRRSATSAAVLASLVLTLGACSGQSDDTGGRGGDAGGRESSAEADPGPDVRVDDSDDFADQTYVAMGDSYTSAPGVEPVDAASGGCDRSEVNYPSLVSGAYGGSTLLDVSCSGATTADVLAPQVLGDGTTVPPQIDAVTAETDLVTLSTGGNDFGVFAILAGVCTDGGCPDLDIATVQEGLAQVTTDLTATIQAIRAKAPDARVLVVGYPQVAPEGDGCDDAPLEGNEVTLARLLNQQLVEAQRSGAEAADAEFVDLWDVTQGHALCADDPWINGLSGEGAAPYHPFAAEQRAAAAEVVAAIDG